ncbi:YkuS family protein [Clostridiaceae bacterium 35-E11]
MKTKVVGVQRELNEIAEELVRQGFEVRDMLDKEKQLDAVIYYNDANDILNMTNYQSTIGQESTLQVNAAKNNIDQIVRKIKEI